MDSSNHSLGYKKLAADTWVKKRFRTLQRKRKACYKLENHVPVKRAKLNDVSYILEKHFGDTWREREELVYYKIRIDGEDDSDEVPEEDENVDQGNTDEVLDLVVYVL
ncbi:hypothetical protein ANN_17357 [Periplaneta americana]|uniref:Uncharacterized protein n=1 Tax=Periplaneta americana TaxID=6978 RepID=A0ABQ8SU52_PERAM|nr:hypothetical protein ANN_17357 [Periplaneta americana]